ncbi:TPA: HAD hydrolase-like protein, partial [Vibrio cholerae O1]
MKIKGVLFDLDGTLVNTSDLIIKTFEYTIKTLLQKNPTQEEITRYFGLPLR